MAARPLKSAFGEKRRSKLQPGVSSPGRIAHRRCAGLPQVRLMQSFAHKRLGKNRLSRFRQGATDLYLSESSSSEEPPPKGGARHRPSLLAHTLSDPGREPGTGNDVPAVIAIAAWTQGSNICPAFAAAAAVLPTGYARVMVFHVGLLS